MKRRDFWHWKTAMVARWMINYSSRRFPLRCDNTDCHVKKQKCLLRTAIFSSFLPMPLFTSFDIWVLSCISSECSVTLWQFVCLCRGLGEKKSVSSIFSSFSFRIWSLSIVTCSALFFFIFLTFIYKIQMLSFVNSICISLIYFSPTSLSFLFSHRLIAY